jgi:drug/metabolite transporter (DMT)-like permease
LPVLALECSRHFIYNHCNGLLSSKSNYIDILRSILLMDVMTKQSSQKSSPLTQRSFWFRDPALWMGGIGILCFSFTLPATRLADPVFGGVVVGLGRTLIAAVLASVLLFIRRESLPPRHTWLGLFLVAFGVVICFPLFSSFALEGMPVAHGAIVNGLLPAATAVGAAIRVRERPSLLFWLSCLAGMGAVLLFAFVQGAGHLQTGDWWMLAAVVTGAVGYTEGGRLARELGGWRAICWALIIAAPLVAIPVLWNLIQHGIPSAPSLSAWIGLAYVSVFSMFLGFFAWYRGLALGGIARISQLQLLQPLLTIGWAALLLGEHLTLLTGLVALLVVLSVAVGQWSRRK